MKPTTHAFAYALALATLAGCGQQDHTETPYYDETFAEHVRALRSSATSAPLKDLVPGNWTTVHIIIGPHTEEWVEREVGAPLPNNQYGFDTEGNILVFKHGQDVTQVKATTGRLMGEGHFSSEATIRGTGSTIEIHDPNPPQPNKP